MKPFLFIIKESKGLLKVALDTSGNGGEVKPLDPFYSCMAVKSPIDGFYYFTMQTTGGPPNNRATYVYKIDPVTFTEVSKYKIPTTNTNTYDTHPNATIAVDEDGHLMITREKGAATSSGAADGHNTDVLFYKTSIVGDLSSIYLHNTIPGVYSYALLSYINNPIYISVRGKATTDLGALTILKSTDKGDNFTVHEIINTGSGGEARAYSSSAYTFDSDDNYLYKILNIRKDSLYSFESVMFLKSLDGYTWQNMDGSFSKDTSVAGPLNITELKNNFMVWEKPNDDYAINYEGGVVKDGIPRLLISKSLRDPSNIFGGNAYQTYEELRFYYPNIGSWDYKDVSFALPVDYYLLWSRERTIQLAWNATKDFIHVVSRDEEGVPFYEFESGDLFASHGGGEKTKLGGNTYYGACSCNNITDRLIIINDTLGSIFDFSSHSNLILIKP